MKVRLYEEDHLLHEYNARTDDDKLHFAGKIWGTKIYFIFICGLFNDAVTVGIL